MINNAGFYSGFGWLTLGRIFGVGTRFGVYEILTAFYKGIVIYYFFYFTAFFLMDICVNFFLSSLWFRLHLCCVPIIVVEFDDNKNLIDFIVIGYHIWVLSH